MNIWCESWHCKELVVDACLITQCEALLIRHHASSVHCNCSVMEEGARASVCVCCTEPVCSDRVIADYALMLRRHSITKLLSVMLSPANWEQSTKPLRPVPHPFPAFAAGQRAARAAHAAPRPRHAAAHQGGHHQGPAAGQDGQHRVLPAGADAEARVQAWHMIHFCTVVPFMPSQP